MELPQGSKRLLYTNLLNIVSSFNLDGIVKSRHSRENGNPDNSNYLKTLDSCLRRNDKKSHFQTFYETINLELHKTKSWN